VTDTATDALAFYAALAQETLQHYPRGPVTIAVTGPDADITRRVADAFGEAVAASGRTVARASGSGRPGEADALKTDVIGPFRRSGGDVQIVDGPQLLRPALRGSWNASIWLENGPVLEGDALESEREYVRDDDPRSAASAVLSVADPDLPVQVFSDSC
jgi:uridine kinase